jgi:4-hydroxybenzoyl-CoA thioesterase/acyl-CoA thioester hydrolase
MSAAFVTTRRVEFSDTDAAGIMHFAAFFRMMEQAEHELLRSVGLSVVMPEAAIPGEAVTEKGGKISWPRVSAKCDYQSPARFEELLEIEVRIARLGRSSVTYQHRFTRDSSLLATGEITAVCCRVREGLPPKSMSIPEMIAQKLRPFVVTPSAEG